jgi:polyprenyl-phospho-N-acetylgalactosaminyl synthase
MICIVIPALNEEARLRTILPLIPSRLYDQQVTVVVVSDGSTDHTAEVANENGAVLVSLPTNCGRGAALRAGLDRARTIGFDYLVTMDGDGQHDPADLQELLRPLVADACDVSFGSRYIRDPGRGVTPINRWLIKKATMVGLRRTIGGTPTDPYCGYRGFSHASLEFIQFRGNHYEGELEVIFDAAIHDLRVAEVPVRKIYSQETSKMGARGGRLRGRIWVLAQYVSTIRRKSRELRAVRRADRRFLVGGADMDLSNRRTEEKGTTG